MATTVQPSVAGDKELLIKQARAGSPWAAYALSLQVRPLTMLELLKVVGTSDVAAERKRAFDACRDGFVVFEDGRNRGAL